MTERELKILVRLRGKDLNASNRALVRELNRNWRGRELTASFRMGLHLMAGKYGVQL